MIRAGEGEPLDMSLQPDRRVLEAALRRRWKITPRRKRLYLAALDAAIERATADGDSRAVASCLKTMVAMEAQNQKDEHLAAEWARIDAGKATARTESNVNHAHTFDFDAFQAEYDRRRGLVKTDPPKLEGGMP